MFLRTWVQEFALPRGVPFFQYHTSDSIKHIPKSTVMRSHNSAARKKESRKIGTERKREKIVHVGTYNIPIWARENEEQCIHYISDWRGNENGWIFEKNRQIWMRIMCFSPIWKYVRNFMRLRFVSGVGKVMCKDIWHYARCAQNVEYWIQQLGTLWVKGTKSKSISPRISIAEGAKCCCIKRNILTFSVFVV